MAPAVVADEPADDIATGGNNSSRISSRDCPLAGAGQRAGVFETVTSAEPHVVHRSAYPT